MSLEGQRIGEFEIIERIGQGGMGAVYKAVQTALQRTVAIKTLQPALAGDPDYIERFHREAIAAAGLNHQNLVQVYAAGETDGLHWFAMEFVKGESAKTRLKRKGCVECGEAIAIGVHVASALDYAWKRARLVHRDIKPDNIFLSGEGEVKLGDLGLAKVADQSQQLTVTGASMGTPHYVSPEQAEGRKDVDLRADIYSLGCTLYHLLSGQTPFTGGNPVTVMAKHVTMPSPDIRGVFHACPRVLAEVILKMMQKDPAARQQNYAEVNADLRRAFDAMSATPMPVVVPRVAAAPRTMVPSRRKRTTPVAAWVGGAVAACLAVGALLYFALWKNGVLTGAERTAAAQQSSPALQRDGDVAVPKPSTTPTAATKDKPFVNTLGQEFVPVPGAQVLFCRWETRVKDYSAYSKVNNVDESWKTQEKDGTPVSREPEYPVVGVSWDDANAFCKWLTAKESGEGKLPKGMRYRIPTDHEWSCAVGIGNREDAAKLPQEKAGKITDVFPWGVDFPPKAKVGNYADSAWHEKFPKEKWLEGYIDGFATTSPVGIFPPNEYGIFDLGGNVTEWCENWYEKEQKYRAMRGASCGSWIEIPSSLRGRFRPGGRLPLVGFRVVLEGSSPVPPAVLPPTNGSRTLPTATKEKPFVNSLGMKFVPVPITGGPTDKQRVLFSVWDVRVQDYEVFAKETKREWPKVDFAQGPTHPAVNVNWDDAQLFCQWLTAREQAAGWLPAEWAYRLPSDHEWSCAVGIGDREDAANQPAEKKVKISDVFPWGTQWPPPNGAGNYAGEEFRPKLLTGKYKNYKDVIAGYTDVSVETAPAGSFAANRFGLYDMGGNVWQWCEDWFDKTQKDRLARGGSWDSCVRTFLLSSIRIPLAPGSQYGFLGFRCGLGESAR